MGLLASIVIWSVFVSGAMTATLAAFAWKHRPQPGTDAFTAMMVVITVWSMSAGIGFVTSDPTLRLLVERVQLFSVFVSVAWVAFALAYSGYEDLITRKTITALSVIPAGTVLIVWTNSMHHLMWRSNRLVTVRGLVLFEHQVGPWWYVNLVYVYGLVVIGTLVLFRLVFFQRRLYADQAIALILGTVAPFALSLLALLGLVPFRAIDITPVGYGVTGLAFGVALYRYELLDWLPATSKIGRITAMDELQEGILIVNPDGRIVDVNQTARQLVDPLADDAVGRPLGDLLPELAERVEQTGDTIATHSIGNQIFEVSKSDIHDHQDTVIGHTLVFWDITDVRLRQQRLEVLNRILRHNVRNDMDAIRAYAELIPADEHDTADLADRIRRTSIKLVELGNKAREIERIMETQMDAQQPVDVTVVIDTVVDRMHNEYPACDLTMNGPGEVWILTDRSTLEAVLENVVENAIEHNDRAEPQVEIAASIKTQRGREWVHIAVIDDGPGIPEYEREAIIQGEESPLEHTSGLGLWLVNWGVSKLGGDLSIDDNDPRGSVVTIQLPKRADASPVDAHLRDPDATVG